MQAGQCNNQMGTMFWEVVCGECRIGGDGKYYGDTDAQLGRINVFSAPHTNGTRDVPVGLQQGDSADFAARLNVKFRDLTDCAVMVVQPSSLEQISQSETSNGPLRSFASAAKIVLCDLGCALKSVGTRKQGE
jgi:hypothetical protein